MIFCDFATDSLKFSQEKPLKQHLKYGFFHFRHRARDFSPPETRAFCVIFSFCAPCAQLFPISNCVLNIIFAFRAPHLRPFLPQHALIASFLSYGRRAHGFLCYGSSFWALFAFSLIERPIKMQFDALCRQNASFQAVFGDLPRFLVEIVVFGGTICGFPLRPHCQSRFYSLLRQFGDCAAVPFPCAQE